MHPITFVTLTGSRAHVLDVLLLAATLRRHGGGLADAPLWMMFPTGAEKLTVPQLEALNQQRVQVVRFSVDERLPSDRP